MTRVRRGIAKLGLVLLAAIGLMACMAAGAQATAWDVNGVLLGETLLPELGGNLKAGTEFLFLTLNSIGQPLVIHCKTLTVTQATCIKPTQILPSSLIIQCLTLINGANQKNCGSEVAGGINILAASALFEPKLHKDHVLLLARPTGANFTQIHYGALCSLPLVSITGSILFECEDGSLNLQGCEVPKVKQLLKFADPALLGDEMKYGANKATLDGELEVYLKGAHVNLPFNAL